jgi:hypothetical protein
MTAPDLDALERAEAERDEAAQRCDAWMQRATKTEAERDKWEAAYHAAEYDHNKAATERDKAEQERDAALCEATEESCADLLKIKELMEVIGRKELELREARHIAEEWREGYQATYPDLPRVPLPWEATPYSPDGSDAPIRDEESP